MKRIISRLSFNTSEWQKPSGIIGKSRNPIHEQIYGFGFEEWLFNNSFFTIEDNGEKWYFGYIEGLHKNYKLGDENSILQLFTIDARTRSRYIVAEINDWKKVDQSESTNLINQNPMLLSQMENDLIALNNQQALSKFLQHKRNENTYQLFNLKFKSFSYRFDMSSPLERSNRIYNLNRFWLYR
jgi:hypothetical protein